MSEKEEHIRDIRCHHCNNLVDVMSIPDDKLILATLPNTLNELKDYGNVDWECPLCKVWNLTSDKE